MQSKDIPSEKKVNSIKVSEIEQCNDKMYDQVAITQIKQELLAEMQSRFLSLENNKHNDNYVDDYLKDQTGSFETEIIFLRNKLAERKNLIKSFRPKNHGHPTSISHNTYKNKDYHQDNMKHIFDFQTKQIPVMFRRTLF